MNRVARSKLLLLLVPILETAVTHSITIESDTSECKTDNRLGKLTSVESKTTTTTTTTTTTMTTMMMMMAVPTQQEERIASWANVEV